MTYYDTLNEEVKEYFKILSPIFPEWLKPYINTLEMQRIDCISISCGMDYTKCFDIKYFYSNLDHSVGVALIIWNFTHDKKQTLAGLFHDIATPVFKHCIDFMNGDFETQESTEVRTHDIINNSVEIRRLLSKDSIEVSEVCDYKMYPIADNDTPKLSADRFEYTFSSGLTFYRIWSLDKIKKIYNNIVITKNEDNLLELAFKDLRVGEEYINIISEIWPQWVSDADRTCMQFIADICKSMNAAGYLSIEDLYSMSEREIIKTILDCKDYYISSSFLKFMNSKNVYKCEYKVEDKYCVNVKTKTRYINPLVNVNGKYVRINTVSKLADDKIKDYLNIPKDGYTYFDFDFKTYESKKLIQTK